MPEGHVIHSLAHDLNEAFGGHRVHVSSPQGRFASQAAILDDSVLSSAEAWGKQLFIHFDVPTPADTVYIHLGLIGKLRFSPYAPPTGQVRLRITDEQVAADLRGPQWCRLITREEMDTAVDRLGADPLRDDADPTATFAAVRRSSRSIASLLMDQKLFAGVGNIYRAETLFRLGIDPTAPGKLLTTADLTAIWDDLVELMHYGATMRRIDTVRPEHTPEAMGRPPRVDKHGGEVYVYRRAGKRCYVCGSPIQEETLDGRNLFWCATCQTEIHCK